MNTQPSSTDILHDYHQSVLEAINPTLQSITKHSSSSTFGGSGSVLSVIFYLKFQLSVEGKSFNGSGGGVSSPGGGALMGTVFTDDLEKLFNETQNFQFNCTPVYTSLLFFDNKSNLLGHFQGGSVSTVLGVGGGSGSWS